MGLTLFKRLQEGTQAVAEELPTPPLPPEAYQSPAVRSLIDQVRQGILPDEALAEIQRDPTSLRSMLAYGEGALGVGTLLAGGEKLPLGGERVPMPERVQVWKAQRRTGDIKEGPKLGEFYTSSEQTAKSLAQMTGDVTQHDLVLERPFKIPAKAEGHHYYDVEELNDLLQQGGVKHQLSEDQGIEPVWRHIDEGGMPLIKALKKAGYDSVQYPEFLGRQDQTTTLVLGGKGHGTTQTQPDTVPTAPSGETGYKRGTTTVRGYGPTHMYNTHG